jgi:transketolase C-terminal domain/subunit
MSASLTVVVVLAVVVLAEAEREKRAKIIAAEGEQLAAAQLRVDSIRSSTAAGSGHPTSSMSAADLLGRQGIGARVIDCYSIKPIDGATLAAAPAATSGRMVIAEDHHPEGGLGSAVTDSLLAAGRSGLSLAHRAVRAIPSSGSGAELLAWAGLDADHIAAAARKLLDRA